MINLSYRKRNVSLTSQSAIAIEALSIHLWRALLPYFKNENVLTIPLIILRCQIAASRQCLECSSLYLDLNVKVISNFLRNIWHGMDWFVWIPNRCNVMLNSRVHNTSFPKRGHWPLKDKMTDFRLGAKICNKYQG